MTWLGPPPLPSYQGVKEAAGQLHAEQRLLGEHEKQFKRSVLKEPIWTEVQKHYMFPADDSVSSYLTDHPATVQILSEAAPKLKEYFGSSTMFKLRTPVDDAGVRSLYVVVVWSGTVRAVRAALENFEDEWWLPTSRRTSEYLVITYELV